MMQRRVAAILAISLVVGCAALPPGAKSSRRQGVSGIVWFKLGYDASSIPVFNHPPDTALRPLPGAIVYLIKSSDIGPNSRAILDSVCTDTLGRYELAVPPGKYYLAVKAPRISSAILSFTPSATVGLDFEVNELMVIEIHAGVFTEHSFKIAELVAQ